MGFVSFYRVCVCVYVSRRPSKCYRWFFFCLDQRTVVHINHFFLLRLASGLFLHMCEVYDESETERTREKLLVSRLIELFVCRSTMLSTIVDLVYDISQEAKTPLNPQNSVIPEQPTFGCRTSHSDHSHFMSEATYFISTSGHPSHIHNN